MEDKEIETLEDVKETKEVSSKKKGNGGLVAVIVILLLICGGLGAFVFVNKDKLFENKTEEKKENKKEEKVQELSLSDSKYIDIYNKLKTYTYEKNRENGYKGFTDEELATIALDDIEEKDFTKTGEKDEFGRDYYSLSSDKLIENLKKYFGSDVTFNFENIVKKSHGFLLKNVHFNEGSAMSIVSYDSGSKTYKVMFSGAGGTSLPHATVNERKIVSAKLKNDTITVEEKAIYYKNEVTDMNAKESVYNIYSDVNKTNEIDTKKFNMDTVANETISVDSYLDKAATITSVYKLDKNSNTYYFVSNSIK